MLLVIELRVRIVHDVSGKCSFCILCSLKKDYDYDFYFVPTSGEENLKAGS